MGSRLALLFFSLVVVVVLAGNFRPERIEKIADRFGLDADETLSNIVVGRVYSHDQQMDLLKPLAVSNPTKSLPP